MEFGVITGHSYLVESFDVMCYAVKVRIGRSRGMVRFVMKMFLVNGTFHYLWILGSMTQCYSFSEVKIKGSVLLKGQLLWTRS